MRRVATLLVSLLLSGALAGCLELSPAHLPDKLLEGRGGNGWARNATASQQEPDRAQMGLVQTQTLVYEDRVSDEGYTGSLTITTLRTLLRPSETDLRATVQERVREEATRKGIEIAEDAATGSRKLASKAESFWFVYDGRVERSGFFTERAEVKVFGEVFSCEEQRTVVVTVGLAQTSDVRSVGGVRLPSDEDDTTWREIVADPTGRIEGIRGSLGLAYNVAC